MPCVARPSKLIYHDTEPLCSLFIMSKRYKRLEFPQCIFGYISIHFFVYGHSIFLDLGICLRRLRIIGHASVRGGSISRRTISVATNISTITASIIAPISGECRQDGEITKQERGAKAEGSGPKWCRWHRSVESDRHFRIEPSSLEMCNIVSRTALWTHDV